MKRASAVPWIVASAAAALGACPVCSGPVPRPVQDAYLGITLLLSALPVALLATGWWLARRFREPGGGQD